MKNWPSFEKATHHTIHCKSTSWLMLNRIFCMFVLRNIVWSSLQLSRTTSDRSASVKSLPLNTPSLIFAPRILIPERSIPANETFAAMRRVIAFAEAFMASKSLLSAFFVRKTISFRYSLNLLFSGSATTSAKNFIKTWSSTINFAPKKSDIFPFGFLPKLSHSSMIELTMK